VESGERTVTVVRTSSEGRVDQALIAVLVVLWAVVLLPGAIRARRRSTMNTVDGFEKAMDLLKPPVGRQVLSVKQAPQLSGLFPVVTEGGLPTGQARVSPVTARRRRNLLVLAGASGFTFLLGLLGGGAFWALCLVAAAALGSYVAWLRNLRLQRLRADEIVSELADLREARELAALSSGSSTARAVGD